MKKIHKGRVLDKKEGFSVIECVSCGFKHIDPIPSEEELTKLYNKDFYSKDKPDYFKNAKEDSAWQKVTYYNYYSLLEKHTSGRKILDIGSGPGDFLVCGKKRGWKTLGVEPSVDAWKYSQSRKVPVINDLFTYEFIKKYGPFDVVHAAMVLEHVPDPVTFIKDMKKLLKPNGLLAIYCPNDYNPLQEILRNELKFKPWWVVPKHHLNYFSVASMKKLIGKIGLKPIEIIGSFPMEFFLLSGLNYVGNDELGRKCQKTRKNFEMNIYKNNTEMLNILYSTLIEKNIGRSFFMIARNK